MKIANFRIKYSPTGYANGLVQSETSKKIVVWYQGKLIERRIDRDEVAFVASGDWRVFYHGPPRDKAKQPNTKPRVIKRFEDLPLDVQMNLRFQQKNAAAKRRDKEDFENGTFIQFKEGIL